MNTSVASPRPPGLVAQRLLTDDAAARAFTHCSDRFHHASVVETASPAHPLFEEVKTYLLRKSMLLNGTIPTTWHTPVIRAYLYDQELFGRSALGFQRLFSGALRAGIVFTKREADTVKTTEASLEIRNEFLGGIPVFQWMPSQPLDAHRVKVYQPSALLKKLRDEFLGNVSNLLQAITAHLGFLVEQRRVGYLEWTAPDVCWYGYFLRGRKDNVQWTKRWTERKRGVENVDIDRQRQGIQSVTFEAYHEHHVYNGTTNELHAYEKLLPNRVGLWLLSLPRWIRRHLRIVDGDIFHELILERDLCVKDRVEETIVEQRVNYSPAVILGPCVLAGWNGRDLMREPIMKLQGPRPVSADVVDDRVADYLLQQDALELDP